MLRSLQKKEIVLSDGKPETVVFARVHEEGSEPYVTVLRWARADEFLKDPEGYIDAEFNGGQYLGHWHVPDVLINPELSGVDVRDQFDAVLGLLVFGDDLEIHGVMAAVFQAAFQLGWDKRGEQVRDQQ